MNTDGLRNFLNLSDHHMLLGISIWWSSAEMGCARKASGEPILIILPPTQQSQLQSVALRTSVYCAPVIKSHAIKIGIGFLNRPMTFIWKITTKAEAPKIMYKVLRTWWEVLLAYMQCLFLSLFANCSSKIVPGLDISQDHLPFKCGAHICMTDLQILGPNIFNKSSSNYKRQH